MSYILEALKKSDKERQQGNVPGLQTQHTLYPGFSIYKRKRTENLAKIAIPGMISICLIMAVLLLRDHLPYTIQKKSTVPELNVPAMLPIVQHPRNSIENAIAPSDQPATARHSEQRNSQLSLPVITSAPKVTDQPLTLQPAPILLQKNGLPLLSESLQTPPATDTDIEIPFIEELSSVVRTNIPKMKFAGHTYAENPDKRMILVNNNIRREGENIEAGLKLEKITWEGVIMDYKGTRFRIITTN